MATIKPFKAVRPFRKKLLMWLRCLMTSIIAKRLRSFAEKCDSFLRVDRPESTLDERMKN